MSAPNNRKLLLTIDDETMVREVTSSLADAAGFESIMAGTLKEIMSGLDKNPDVIVLDMTMPEMDGIEVIWELRRRKCSAHLVISSGFVSSSIKAAELIAAKSDLKSVTRLDKPFDSARMLVLLDNLLTGMIVPSGSPQ